jgi:protoporphyrinogen/coproporphyrinogen III oxidase
VGYTEKVVVIGAGISGLACAYRLKQLGIPCLVLEAQERPGGLISTIRKNGFLFETGPQFPRFPALVWRLVNELNLQSEFVAGDSGAKRYIVRNARLHRAPFSPTGLLGTSLIGIASKLRILTEVFGSSKPPLHEESLAEFVRRKFGDEVLDYLVDPLVSTIFFGDARKMGMESAFPALVEWERNHGSLVRGAIRARNSRRRLPEVDASPRQPAANGSRDSFRVTSALPSLGSFRSGMAALPEKLAGKLHGQIRYRARIACVTRVPDAKDPANAAWQIVSASGEKIAAKHLILAVPAYAAAQLLANAAPQLASQLNTIEFAPVCSVAFAYDRSQVSHPLDGFGFMVPRRESWETICTFWNSSVLPGRAPEGKVLITSFAGRLANDGAQMIGEEEYARIVQAENALALGITGEPLDRVAWQDPKALPQYNVGHARRIAEIRDILRVTHGLGIVGNFLHGRSIGECVESGFAAAEDAHSRIHGQNIQALAGSN